MVGTLPLYRSGQSYTLTDARPPVANDLDDGEAGAIFRVQTSEGPIQEFAIAVIGGRRYLQPWDSAAGAATQYLSGTTYRVGVYPHQSTVQADVILDWGEIKQISEIKGGRLSWKRYEDAITGWIPGDIWLSPESIGDEVDVDWSQYSTWDVDNPNGFLAWGTELIVGRRIVDLLPSGEYVYENVLADGASTTEINYRNFGGVAGLSFQISYISSERFNFTGSGSGLGGASIDSTIKPELVGKELKHITGGIEFTVPAGHFFTYNFRFTSAPVYIDSIDIIGSSAARTNFRFGSGLLRWAPFRSLRRETPKLRSDYFFGSFQEYEVFESLQGWPSGTIDNPITAGPFNIDIACDGFYIYVDNRQFEADTVFRLTNWKIRPVMLGDRYRVDFDLANNRLIGVPLISANETVILTDQNKRGGWIRSEAFAYGQDFSPTIENDQLQGFYEGQSEWGTRNDVIYKLRDDAIDGADWFLQNAAGLAHPFGNIKLQSYPESTSLPVNVFDAFNTSVQGFYGYFDQTIGFNFVENRSYISVLNSDLENRGYAIPSLNFNVFNDVTNINIQGGKYNRFLAYSKLYDLKFVSAESDFPAEITQKEIYIARFVNPATNSTSFPYRIYDTSRNTVRNGIIRNIGTHQNIYSTVNSVWFNVVILGETLNEASRTLIVLNLLEALNFIDLDLYIDGGPINIISSEGMGYANSGYINIETAPARGLSTDIRESSVGHIFLTTGDVTSRAVEGGIVFAKNTTPVTETGSNKFITGYTWEIDTNYEVGWIPKITTSRTPKSYRGEFQFTEKTIEFIDPQEDLELKELIEAETKFELTGNRARDIPQEILSRPDVQLTFDDFFNPEFDDPPQTSVKFLVRFPGKSVNQWMYGPLIQQKRTLPDGSTDKYMTFQAANGSVHNPLMVWVKGEEKGYFLTNAQRDSLRNYEPVVNNLYPVGGGEEQIVHSAIAPVPTTEKPQWRYWHQETSRALYQFTTANVAGQWHPVPIPWCCAPVKEYELLKPFTLDRTSEIPARLTTQPAWQIRTVETETELRRYTWAKVGDQVAIVPIPWTSVIEGVRTIVPEFVLTKTESGTFDGSTNTTEDQFIRSDELPTISNSRPTWEYYIFDNGSVLGMFTHAKIGDSYRPIQLPLGLSLLDDVLTPEFVLTPTGAPGDVGAANTEVGDVVTRSDEDPEISTIRPRWLLWIKETDVALSWFMWVHIGSQYIPLRLPWTYSYNSVDRTLEPQFELLKPAA